MNLRGLVVVMGGKVEGVGEGKEVEEVVRVEKEVVEEVEEVVEVVFGGGWWWCLEFRNSNCRVARAWC